MAFFEGQLCFTPSGPGLEKKVWKRLLFNSGYTGLYICILCPEVFTYSQSVSQLMHAQKCRLSWRWNKRQAWMGCIGRKEGIRITLRLKKEGFIERICRLFSLHFESYRHIPQNSRNSGKKRCGTLNNIAQFHHSNEENPWIKQTGSCSIVLGPY